MTLILASLIKKAKKPKNVFLQRFCGFGWFHVLVTMRLRDAYRLKRFEDFVEKIISGYIWHRSFVHTVKCSFFNQITVNKSFFGALLTLVQWSNRGFPCPQSLNKPELVEFRAKRQIRRERREAAVFAGYKVGEEMANIGSVAVLRFSYRDHQFLKQITKLKANQIHQNLHTSQSRVGTTRSCDR